MNRAVFSPDGKYIVTTSFDRTARVWDAQTGRTMVTYTHQAQGHVNQVAFSPDGKYVASSGLEKTARLWDVQTGQEVRRFERVDGTVTFSSDGKYILTSNLDGTARVWLRDIHDTIRAVCAVLTRDLTSDERVEFGISNLGSTYHPQ